jgi:hypothetical protein
MPFPTTEVTGARFAPDGAPDHLSNVDIHDHRRDQDELQHDEPDVARARRSAAHDRSTSRSARPVYEPRTRATASGVPVATMVPP